MHPTDLPVLKKQNFGLLKLLAIILIVIGIIFSGLSFFQQLLHYKINHGSISNVDGEFVFSSVNYLLDFIFAPLGVILYTVLFLNLVRYLSNFKDTVRAKLPLLMAQIFSIASFLLWKIYFMLVAHSSFIDVPRKLSFLFGFFYLVLILKWIFFLLGGFYLARSKNDFVGGLKSFGILLIVTTFLNTISFFVSFSFNEVFSFGSVLSFISLVSTTLLPPVFLYSVFSKADKYRQNALWL